ncbi:hypothetical protein Rhopal_003902-T1 [Rhodotorula paludigena]|uniref:DUF1772-domain-containing protein n=1 Tax=Rhodotorula paludigena TaxID=86838 RepID=A0AAV5GKZ2_9BASI|nr:hypothetical protein Rhopal_003902-T1 [Rhodotorula paludigena]
MASSDSATLVLARSTAVVGLGIASGLMIGIPAWTWPALYRPNSNLKPEHRLGIFVKVYNQGKTTMMSTIPVITALLGYSAVAAKAPVDYLPANFVSRHRKAFLAASAASAVGFIAWTGAMMMGLNNQLMKLEKENRASKDDELVQKKWLGLHLVRCALGSTAFVLAVAELALA